MASAPTVAPADRVGESAAAWRELGWMGLLPAHRRPVIAKTPLLVALGAYLAGGRVLSAPVVGTMAVAALLWAVLYALNEVTDLRCEQGVAVPPPTVRALGAAPEILCVVTAFASVRLATLLAAMVAGQTLYCVPPFRLKRWWWAILIFSGIVNPLLRLECGAIWSPMGLPPIVPATVVSLHLAAALRSRATLRGRDRSFGYAIAPPGCEAAGIVFSVIGLAGAGYVCWSGILPRGFIGFVACAAGFALYAWSGRAKSMEGLRRAWVWFAVMAVFALIVLAARR